MIGDQIFSRQIIRIRCAVCDRYVERISVEPNRAATSFRLLVECHGDRDEMNLTEALLQEAGPGGMPSEGVAFTTKRLPADG